MKCSRRMRSVSRQCQFKQPCLQAAPCSRLCCCENIQTRCVLTTFLAADCAFRPSCRYLTLPARTCPTTVLHMHHLNTAHCTVSHNNYTPIIIIIKKVKIIVTLSIKNTAGALYKSLQLAT